MEVAIQKSKFEEVRRVIFVDDRFITGGACVSFMLKIISYVVVTQLLFFGVISSIFVSDNILAGALSLLLFVCLSVSLYISLFICLDNILEV